MTPFVIVLFGRPGAGKGTFAECLAEFGITSYSTGQLLRDAAAGDRPEQVNLRRHLADGWFASDDVIEAIVGRLLNTADAPIALDGFPRTLPQLDWLIDYGRPFIGIVIHAPEEICVRRLLARRTCPVDGTIDRNPTDRCRRCGGQLVVREDDARIETIRRRLDLFDRVTRPVIDDWMRRHLPLLVIANDRETDRPFDSMRKAIVDNLAPLINVGQR
jgi:adenylate kinase